MLATIKELQEQVQNKVRLVFKHLTPGGEGGIRRKVGWGCATRFSKPSPYL